MKAGRRLREDRVLHRSGRLLSGYEASSIRALLHAACSSPTARQAVAACTALLLSCWRDPPSGSRKAVAADLPPLVRALRSAVPELRSVEDYLPLDPRLVVRFRARHGERSWDFRVHPGSAESPLDVWRQLANYADALDPLMEVQLGVGIGDMIDVAGGMLDHELALLAPAWSDAVVSLDSPPFVTEAEVEAAAGYLRALSDGPPELHMQLSAERGERRGRAAQVLTRAAADLSFSPGPFSPSLGPGVIVDSPAGKYPVPAGLILEGLDPAVMRIVTVLTSAAGGSRLRHSGSAMEMSTEDGPPGGSEAEREPADRWRARSWSDLEVLCRGIALNVLQVVTGTGDEMVIVVTGHRHVVAIELVAELAAEDVTIGVADARRRLASFGPGSQIRLAAAPDDSVLARLPDVDDVRPDGELEDGLIWPPGFADALPLARTLFNGEAASLAPGTEVTRLVVVDGLWRPDQLWDGGIPACTLDEARALLAERSPESTDLEEKWAFLDELTRLAAVDGSTTSDVKLWFWSILDAWAVWRARGVLFPAWPPRPVIGQIAPRDLEPAWEQAAALDEVDQLLAAHDIPGIHNWMSVIQTPVPAIDPDQGAFGWVTTLGLASPRVLIFASPDQPLLVTVDLEFRQGLTFSRAQMITLANTVQDTLYELARVEPVAWAVWLDIHEHRPAMVTIRPLSLPDDGPAVRLGVVMLGEPVTELWCDPAKLRGVNGPEIHRLIGQALEMALLARLRAPAPIEDDGATSGHDAHTKPAPDDPSVTKNLPVAELHTTQDDLEYVARFSEAWHRMRPRIYLRRAEIPFEPYSIDSPQTLTSGGIARAARSAARNLAGKLTAGDHSVSAVIHELCPATMQSLHQGAELFDARAALAAACAELERTLNDRFTAALDIDTMAAAPWESDELHSMIAADAYQQTIARTRVAQLLVECLLHQAPSGQLVPDRRDVHHLLDLARAALEASLIAQHAYAAIRSCRMNISEVGDVTILDVDPATPRLDIGAWRDAQMATAQSPAATELDLDDVNLVESGEPPSEGLGEYQSFRALLEAQMNQSDEAAARDAADMLAVDDALIAASGLSFDSILAVLKTVTSWPVPGEPSAPIATVGRAALVDDVVAWSGLPESQVNLAVQACTLTAEDLQAEGLPYWQIEQRSARLALRPLIKPPNPVDDELWLLPRSAHATQRLWARYLNDGRIPWPDRDQPKSVRLAADRWRRHAEAGLERLAADAANNIGLPCRARLTTGKAASHGLEIPGEIDLLVADPDSRRMWVVEAKHLKEPFGPMEMAFHVARFHGPTALAIDVSTHQFRQFTSTRFRSFDDVLGDKVEAVGRNTGAALRALGIHTADGSDASVRGNDGLLDWHVTGVFVTGHVEIAAFSTGARFPFVSVDRFKEFLQDGSSFTGWWKRATESPVGT